MMIARSRKISGGASFFLDVLRLSASLVVLFVHAHLVWFPSQVHSPSEPGHTAHAAVIVFFVLSGFVIAHTTCSNNRGPLQYAQARLSRLYSVVLPAIFITALAEFLIWNIDPTLQEFTSRGESWPRYIVSAFFINEIWLFSAAPPVNGPLWSLSFEFWYYAIFGLWFFRGKGWKSLILPILACLLAGPKILIMMPIWIMGYFAYLLPQPKLLMFKSWFLVFSILAVAFLLVMLLPVFPFGIGITPLASAGGFITDWIIGLFVATSLWLLPSEKESNAHLIWVGKFRKIADLTFPIYVLHFPLLLLWRALFNFQENNILQLWQALVSVLLVSICIGTVLEKYRHKWNQFFNWTLTLGSNILFKKEPLYKNSKNEFIFKN